MDTPKTTQVVLVTPVVRSAESEETVTGPEAIPRILSTKDVKPALRSVEEEN
jgi:hypothetical protein